MTDPDIDDTTIARAPAADAAPAAPDTSAGDVAEPAPIDPSTPPQYGIGPFSLREVILGGVWLVAFIVSFFPLNLIEGDLSALLGGSNVWVSGLAWVLTIGVPTAAVFLLVLRRLSPQGIRRVGSLGIDQFASVAFSVAAVVWLAWLWDTVAVAIEFGEWTRSWVLWVEVVLFLAGVVLTVFAPFIPGIEQDFQDRPDAPAHRNARPVRALSPRPVRERPAATPAAAAPDAAAYAPQNNGAHAPQDTGAHAPQDTGAYAPQDTGAYAPQDAGAHAAQDTDVLAPLSDDLPPTQEWTAADETVVTAAPTEPAARPQPFWALVPVERDVVDEYGAPLFRIGPTAWALVIEDRGDVFVVRAEDGRVGYLHDVSGVTRG